MSEAFYEPSSRQMVITSAENDISITKIGEDIVVIVNEVVGIEIPHPSGEPIWKAVR